GADQVGDPAGDDAGLAGAGAGQDQQRSGDLQDRFALLGVQVIEEYHVTTPAGRSGAVDAGAPGNPTSAESPDPGTDQRRAPSRSTPWRRRRDGDPAAVIARAIPFRLS